MKINERKKANQLVFQQKIFQINKQALIKNYFFEFFKINNKFFI